MKKILAVIFLALVLIGGVFLIIRQKDKLYMPSQIPSGFKEIKPYISSLNDNGETVYTILYQDQDGAGFSFSQEKKGNLSYCQPPAENSLAYDYINFRPNNAQWGCAVSINIGKAKRRIFHWLIGETKFTLLVRSDSISDNQGQSFAESLKR